MSIAVHSSSRAHDGSVPHQLQPPNVVQFAEKLDCLLELLDSTADALAAEWDLRSDGTMVELDQTDGGFGPLIQ